MKKADWDSKSEDEKDGWIKKMDQAKENCRLKRLLSVLSDEEKAAYDSAIEKRENLIKTKQDEWLDNMSKDQQATWKKEFDETTAVLAELKKKLPKKQFAKKMRPVLKKKLEQNDAVLDHKKNKFPLRPRNPAAESIMASKISEKIKAKLNDATDEKKAILTEKLNKLNVSPDELGKKVALLAKKADVKKLMGSPDERKAKFDGMSDEKKLAVQQKIKNIKENIAPGQKAKLGPLAKALKDSKEQAVKPIAVVAETAPSTAENDDNTIVGSKVQKSLRNDENQHSENTSGVLAVSV